MSHMRVFKWEEFILELDYSPFLTSTEGSFVIIDAVLSLLRSVFDTITIRVLLLSSESVFNTTCQHGALLHCKQGNCSY